MDRQQWLAERRAAVLADYDREAPSYDQHPYPAEVQRQWVARLLRLVPAGAAGSTANGATGTSCCAVRDPRLAPRRGQPTVT